MSHLTFNRIPIELIDNVFQHLNHRDLLQCQKVCRTWYLPAHLTLLNQVHLIDNTNVDSFLTAIGDNYLYLKAVKYLELGDKDDDDPVDTAHAERALSYLQSLAYLTINGDTTFAQLLNNTTCREAVKRLCRRVHLYSLDQDALENLYGFPYLQQLYFHESPVLVNFEAWMTLFEQQFQLKMIHGTLSSGDKDDFMESCKHRAQSLIKKIASVKSLELEAKIFCPNSIQFLSRYFTGVIDFNYVARFVKTNWTDAQINAFCGDLLDFASAMENAFSIKVWSLNESTFSKLLPSIMQKVFHQPPPNLLQVERQLQINIYHNANYVAFYNPVNFTVKSVKSSTSRATRSLDIRSGVNQAILHHIKGAVSISCNINTFIFSFLYNLPPTYLTIFQQILDRLPTLTKVVLSMPKSCKFPKTEEKQYAHVEQLELNVGHILPQEEEQHKSDVAFPETFNQCMAMFSGTKHLKLHYFSGFTKDDTNHFEVPLQHMSLDSLYLDVTPVLHKTKQIDSYFVLCVQTRDQAYFYKVSFSFLRMTKIDTKNDTLDLQNSTQVTINVGILKFIKLYLFKKILDEYYDRAYLQSSTTNEVMEANLSLI